MEVLLADVSFDANVWDVKRALGAVLHGESFFDTSDPKARPMNFKITLNQGHGGVQNNGSGSVILPNRKVGDKFLKLVCGERVPVVINGRKMRFFRSKNKPGRGLQETLEKTPYMEPELEEKREDKLRRLDIGLHVDKLQFGIFYRRPKDPMTASRVFSNEYEISHREKGAGLLWFEYDHKLIRIQLGDRMTEEIGSNVAISFANIRKVAIGIDFGNPFICFELLVPPMLERERFNRTLLGDWNDERKFRQRLGSLNEAHAVVAPYAHHMRLILHTEADIHKFRELCVVADLKKPIWANVEAFNQGFFSPRKLYTFHNWLSQFSWPVAFQLESLIRGGLMHTDDLLVHFRGYIETLCRDRPGDAADILRHFSETLRTRNPQDTVLECFERVLPGRKWSKSMRNGGVKSSNETGSETERQRDAGKFSCYHVTFTPTRMLLEGPYSSQSNRVIRQFAGYEDHFIRVDFRDEDRLQYRWAREVDGTTLLLERVGGVLKNGFELGGRRFEFLAYSSSALREHAVWFMNPFTHDQRGWIDSQKIRDSLGNFSKKLKNTPSKYAARLAQAFTATDPSVSITGDEWEEIEDMGEEPYLFTDGVGTISKELADMIWEALCTAKEDLRRLRYKPCAYQIRFLGYKGMVGIDERLPGVKMRLRKSMNKFEGVPEDGKAPIEIARWFDKPGTAYLNRALVMILEDRGVDKSVFIKLQENAIADVVKASDSIEQTVTLLKMHNLGLSFHLPWILQRLGAASMGMEAEKKSSSLQNTFLYSLIAYAKNHVLRDMKHSARIPIPDSYLLVGVADEGPTYEDVENVFTLKKGQIFACIQREEDDQPVYLQGTVVISRSPVVHPGDAQRVFAIGEPPADMVCAFRNLRNVVVLPSAGERSLASMLGGGDLDGDLYSIIKYNALLPTNHADAAAYEPVGTRTLPDGQEATVEDICDFIVEYINSDVLGLLSDRHLIIADQSRDGTSDPACISLAELCSQAVDYPKNGVQVDIHDSPRLLIRSKPDWKMAEDDDPRDTDYYISTRALGDLFRSITISKPKPPAESFPAPEGSQAPGRSPARETPLSDPISQALKPFIERQLHYFMNDDRNVADMRALFLRYERELRYICVTHALSDAPDIRLQEEEVAIGTILANCSQHRWRTDRMHRMRMHASELARDTRFRLFQPSDLLNPEQGELLYGVSQAWLAWDFGMRNSHVFGARTFSLIALQVVLDTLYRLGGIP